MRRVTTIADVRRAVADARATGHQVALAPTMGALHDGHLANVRLAGERADVVVVSIFVNPTQFDRADDLAGYPRDLEGDEQLLASLGDAAPALVFAPEERDVYPRPPRTTVHVEDLSEGLEGVSRPGHFDGVATVVTKLCNIVQPDLLVLGRKDAQQNAVVRTMLEDLNQPVELVLGPTIRDADGLALSSRNRLLSPTDRREALALSQALRRAVLVARDARDAGRAVDADEVRREATATLDAAPGVTVDYLEVVDPDTFAPPDAAPTAGARGEDRRGGGPVTSQGPLLVAVAAYVGPVRLIDNVELGHLDDEDRLLAATAGGAG